MTNNQIEVIRKHLTSVKLCFEDARFARTMNDLVIALDGMGYDIRTLEEEVQDMLNGCYTEEGELKELKDE